MKQHSHKYFPHLINLNNYKVMYILYFESKNGKFRYYVNYVEYDSNGKIKHVIFTLRTSIGFNDKFYAMDNENKVKEIATYVISHLINRSHYRKLDDDGYTFIVKKL